MEVQHDVITASSDQRAELPEASNAARTFEYKNAIKRGMALDNGSRFSFDGPVDLRVGKGVPKGGQRGKDPYDIADSGETNNQNAWHAVYHETDTYPLINTYFSTRKPSGQTKVTARETKD